MKPWAALLVHLTNLRVTRLRYSLEDGQSRSDLVDGRTIATRLYARSGEAIYSANRVKSGDPDIAEKED